MNKSTISRELRLNRDQRGCRPRQAQALCDERHRDDLNAKRFTQADWEGVEFLLQLDMSLDQVAGVIRVSFGFAFALHYWRKFISMLTLMALMALG